MEELRKRFRDWRLGLRDHHTLKAAGSLLGVSAVQMHRYEKGEQKVPATKVREIEAITGIPREILRPDVFGAKKHHDAF
jgi:DNA-binding transcriptional regulator YdaS (Cro superfamily)